MCCCGEEQQLAYIQAQAPKIFWARIPKVLPRAHTTDEEQAGRLVFRVTGRNGFGLPWPTATSVAAIPGKIVLLVCPTDQINPDEKPPHWMQNSQRSDESHLQKGNDVDIIS